MSDPPPEDDRFCGIGLWLEAPVAGEKAHSVTDRAARAASQLAGTGTVWISEPTAGPPEDAPYEAYALLGALAVRTTGVRLGVAADDTERRAPSMLAKIVTGIDVLSGGRAVLALHADAGDPDGIRKLAEALAVARAVLEDEHPVVEGVHHWVRDAVNRPSPVQPGGVPIVAFLTGAGSVLDGLVESAARGADALVVDVGTVARTLSACRAAAGSSGSRSPAVVGRLGSGDPAATADGVAGVRTAGAAGCLVGVPYPWDPGPVAAAVAAW